VAYHLGLPFEKVPVHRIPDIPWYRNMVPGANVHRLYLDMLLLLKCTAVARAFRPDLVHAHLHEGGFAALPFVKLFRCPLLLDLEGSLAGELAAYGFPGIRLFSMLEHWMNTTADRVVASSRILADTVRLHVRESERITLLADCIDTERFAPQHGDRLLRAQLGFPQNAPIAVYLGTLDCLQGLDILLQVARAAQERFPALRFLIMGGPGEDAWQQRSRDAGIGNIVFTGAIDSNDAPRYCALGDLAISLKRSASHQANGKLLDYMAMGLPTVAFDTPGNREILGHDGVLVPEGDGGAVIDAIGTLLENQLLRQKIGSALRKRAVDCFSENVREKELMNIYSGMVRAGGVDRTATGGGIHEM
jgi:glycosyltransferase involved in cell wall biosynthesis